MIRPAITLLMTLVLTLMSFTAQADTSAVIFSGNYQEPVAVRYKMRADHIGRTITISSNEQKFAAKLMNIQKAKRYLIEEIGRRGQAVVHEGQTSLQQSEGYLKASYDREPQAQVYILLPVVRESDNIYTGGGELIELMAGIELPGKARFTSSAIHLAVEDPERMRGILLEMISKDIRFTRDRIKSTGKIVLSGLEGPVRVSQFDDINVELFIEYKMSMEVQ